MIRTKPPPQSGSGGDRARRLSGEVALFAGGARDVVVALFAGGGATEGVGVSKGFEDNRGGLAMFRSPGQVRAITFHAVRARLRGAGIRWRSRSGFWRGACACTRVRSILTRPTMRALLAAALPPPPRRPPRTVIAPELAAARDGSGAVYVADGGNHATRRVERNGLVRTVVGSVGGGVSGSPQHQPIRDGVRGCRDGVAGPAAVDGVPAALLDTPSALAVAADDTLYVADTANHRIRVVSPEDAGNGLRLVGAFASIHKRRRSEVTPRCEDALSSCGCVVSLPQGRSRAARGWSTSRWTRASPAHA